MVYNIKEKYLVNQMHITSPMEKQIMSSLFYEADTDTDYPALTPKTETKLSLLLNNINIAPITEKSTVQRTKASLKRKLFESKPNTESETEVQQTPKRQRNITESHNTETRAKCRDIKPTRVAEPVINQMLDSEDIIGDGSQAFCLPTVTGKHKDLKSISAQTLNDVMSGQYDDVIGNYRIIDCRYPYEYEGGHIKGARNIYTEEGIIELLNEKSDVPKDKRNILIFHCEFSSERGPKKCRFLRNRDRHQNQENYPRLNYPELYILDQGYKNFHTEFKHKCTPEGYTPMLHSDHHDDLRHFRKKSKTWSGGEKRNFSRLNLRL